MKVDELSEDQMNAIFEAHKGVSPPGIRVLVVIMDEVSSFAAARLGDIGEGDLSKAALLCHAVLGEMKKADDSVTMKGGAA